MTQDQIIAFLNRFTYKPGYQLKAESFTRGHIILRIRARVPDADNPDQMIDLGRSMVLSVPTARNEEYVLWWLTSVLRDLEHHELNEWLKLDGKRVREPHKETS